MYRHIQSMSCECTGKYRACHVNVHAGRYRACHVNLLGFASLQLTVSARGLDVTIFV